MPLARALLTLLAVLLLAPAAAVAQDPIVPLPPLGGSGPGSGSDDAPPPDQNGQADPDGQAQQPGRPQDPPKANAPAPPVGPAPGSVSDRVDVAHTGFFGDEDLIPPLEPRWKVPIGARFVLAAEGHVFAVGNELVALDATTGKVLWRRPSPPEVEGATYDEGRIFVSTFDDLDAYSAATGEPLWSRHIMDVAFNGHPLASGGVVYLETGQGGTVMRAFDGAGGNVLWSEPTTNGSTLAALDAGRLYSGGACANTTAIDRHDGTAIWRYRTGCSGGADVTTALYGGRLWVPEADNQGGEFVDPPLLDAGSGARLGRWRGALPVFVDGLAVSVADGGLQAVDAMTGAPRWRVAGGDRTPDARIAIGHDVYGIADRRLTAFGAEDGRVLWRAPRQFPLDLPTGVVFAAAPDTLLVATDKQLTAWQTALKPPPRGIALAVERDVIAGHPASAGGVLGTELRHPGAPVLVQAAPPRGRFRTVARTRVARDGGFGASLLHRRNDRIRVVTGGVTSRAQRVFVVPDVRLGQARQNRAGTRVRVRAVVRTAAPLLAGRRFVLYLLRERARHVDRVAVTTLRRAGRGRTAADLRFAPLRHVRAGDTLTWCIPGAHRLGLGRATALTRTCGARRIRFR